MNSTATPTQILRGAPYCSQQSGRQSVSHGVRPTSLCILPYPLPHPTRDYSVIGVRRGLSIPVIDVLRRLGVQVQRRTWRKDKGIRSVLFLFLHIYSAFFRPPNC